jgi:hypothetical protein
LFAIVGGLTWYGNVAPTMNLLAAHTVRTKMTAVVTAVLGVRSVGAAVGALLGGVLFATNTIDNSSNADLGMNLDGSGSRQYLEGTVRVLRQKLEREDVIASHTCSLEASRCVV